MAYLSSHTVAYTWPLSLHDYYYYCITNATYIIYTSLAPSHGPSVISAYNVEVNVSKPPSVNLTWDLVDDNEIIGYEVNHKIAGQTTGQDSFLVPGQHPSVLIVFPPEDIGLSHDLVVYASNWGPYRSPPSPPVSIVPATGMQNRIMTSQIYRFFSFLF